MKKINDFFRNLSITWRFTLIILLAMILLSVSILYSANLYRKERINSYYDIIKSDNEQFLDKLNGYATDIANVTKIPLTYTQNETKYLPLLADFNVKGVNTYDFQKENEQIFEQIMTFKSDVNSCYIFNIAGNADYKVKYAIYRPFNPKGTTWFNDAIDAFGKPVFVDTYVLPNVVNQRLNPVYVFGIARGIVQLKSGSVIGVLLVNTEVNYIAELCEDIKLTENQHFLVLHGDNCIYDSTGICTGTTLNSDSVVYTLDPSADTFTKVKYNDRSCYATSLYSKEYGIRIVSFTPVNELFWGINQIQLENFIQILVIIVCVLLITIIALRRLIAPIILLSSMMKIAESGDFTSHINLKRDDEIGRLADSYNSMIDKINNLIHEVYLAKINSNELEMQMLQAQINPHFLYNTLESISMMATINDDDTSADMAASLGSILRYSISNLNEPVTLSDEINHIKQYIELQEYRFKKQYTFNINIPAKYYSYPTPKLVLQPVVENAIYHGMSTVRTGGLITINAIETAPGILEISVTDNGSGIPEDKLIELNDYINEKNEHFKSIGLRNVNRRIKIFCGSEVGLIVSNAKQGGTCVTIILQKKN